MKRLSIKLDPQVEEWLSEKARADGRSVAQLVEAMLRIEMRVQRARKGFPRLTFKPFPFKWKDGRRPTRDELYDRPRLR